MVVHTLCALCLYMIKKRIALVADTEWMRDRERARSKISQKGHGGKNEWTKEERGGKK